MPTQKAVFTEKEFTKCYSNLNNGIANPAGIL